MIAFLFIVMVASPAVAGAQSLQPEAWDAGVRLAEAADVNPDPKIVEVMLEARVSPLEIVPGTRTDVWTYNGGLPGPLIRARRGDRVIVHFSNSLPQPTTVHWHGCRCPSRWMACLVRRSRPSNRAEHSSMTSSSPMRDCSGITRM